MGLLEQADSFSLKESDKEYIGHAQEMGYEMDINFFSTCQYLGIDKDSLGDSDKMNKAQKIYDWAKERGDPLEVIRELDIYLGKPVPMEKLNKIFVWTSLDNEQAKDIKEIEVIQKQKRKLYES